MKKFKLLFTQQAREEITKSRNYYNKQLSGLGNEFTNELKKTIDQIKQNPLQFPECFPPIHQANTSRFPFSIYYHIQDLVIKVIAVFHNSRNPDKWKERKD